jgi:hypothetical protein
MLVYSGHSGMVDIVQFYIGNIYRHPNHLWFKRVSGASLCGLFF